MKNFIPSFNHAGAVLSACMVFLLFITGCCKEEIYTTVLSCINESQLLKAENSYTDTIESPTNPWGEFIYNYPQDYGYFEPDFNPNNPNQICFIRQRTDGNSVFELCTYDFCSKQLNVLVSSTIFHPRWGKKNWILFTHSDNQIWRVKPNGDSLMRIPLPIGINTYAEWDTSGNYLMYEKVQPGGALYIASIDGTVIDTAYIGASPIRWRLISPTLFYVTTGDGTAHVTEHNLQTNTSRSIAHKEKSITGNSGFGMSNWNYVSVGKSELFLSEPFGIWSVDKLTGHARHILKGADNRYYLGIQIDKNNERIISTRYDFTQHGDTLDYASNLYLYNLKTQQEYKLEF